MYKRQTIDSAKAIAMGVYYDGDIWEVYEQGKPVEKALPVATVLTIPAAGSESSGDSVITNEEKQLKFGYGSPLIRPLLSVMDPELFFTLPKNQLANGVADMMSPNCLVQCEDKTFNPADSTSFLNCWGVRS